MTAPPALRAAWALDPDVSFLNHGSFGATPRAVLDAQQAFRARLEAEPVRFLVRELPALLEAARAATAAFVGVAAEALVFVPNATTAVNAVLRSRPLAPGDELLITDHGYAACNNAVVDAARRGGARVVRARVPFPCPDADAALDAIVAAAGPRTRLAVIDHVTSPTALVLPVERIVAALQGRGIDVLVDGAHGPGMLRLSLDELGAAYYVGNAHKWLCGPKGVGFLAVREDRRDGLRPTVIGHGATQPRDHRARFQLEFDWPGTHDPTPYLCLPAAIETIAAMLPGGWDAVRARNREATLAARRALAAALDVELPCPDGLIGAMAALELPDSDGPPPGPPTFTDPLQDTLLARFGVEVPVVSWPAPPRRLLRISMQLYNGDDDVSRLIDALHTLRRDGVL